MTDGWEQHLARERGPELADLRLHWDEAYDIGWDEEFVAVRRGGGATIFSPTARGLDEAMRIDYSMAVPSRPTSPGQPDGQGGQVAGRLGE